MRRIALHWQILIAMIAGAAIGIALNAWAGTRVMSEPAPIQTGTAQLHGMAQAIQLRPGRVWIEDTPNQILIQIDAESPSGERFETRRIVVRGELRDPREVWPPPHPQAAQNVPRRVVSNLDQLQQSDPEAYVLLKLQGRSLARRIGDMARALGDLFLRLLKMVSVPLIIASLITGVTGLGQAERLGKMFGRTIIYYLATSALAIATGLLFVNLIQPGVEADAKVVAPAAAGAPHPREGKSLGTVLFEQVENMIPGNPFAAIAEGNFLPIISFSLAFGVFAILVGGKTGRTIGELSEALFEVMMRMTMAIIHIAPLGVFFMILATTAGQGAGVFLILGKYMATVAGALAVHACVTMPLILLLVARRSPLQFARAMSPALLTAFSSASSNATLPLTLTCAEERAGVSNRVTSFVLPLGATVNMDGTALYEVVAVLFIAQATPGVDLTMVDQLIVAATALLASVGAAGIPHAGLVMMTIILQAVGLPTEAQALILAVDRVLDMGRTAVNVWSDSCGCAVIGRFER